MNGGRSPTKAKTKFSGKREMDPAIMGIGTG